MTCPIPNFWNCTGLDANEIESSLVQVMAWCWSGNKLLSGPLLTNISVAIWHHQKVMRTSYFSIYFMGYAISKVHFCLLTLYMLCFFRENINIYLHFMSFLHTTETRVVEIPPRVIHRTCLFYIINIMAADVLAMQGAKASATMILT